MASDYDKTNFGRACDWYIELDGVPIARLTDYHCADQYWYSYHVRPADLTTVDRIYDLFELEWWNAHEGRIAYRNIDFDCYANPEMVIVSPDRESGRISMRSLCIGRPRQANSIIKPKKISLSALFGWLCLNAKRKR